MLDKTPNAPLAERNPPFCVSLCYVHQGMQCAALLCEEGTARDTGVQVLSPA